MKRREEILYRSFIVFLFLIRFTSPTYGNDTIASINGGQLVFEKSEDISMESENLEISPTKVKVTYEFLNNSDKSIRGIVAFPIAEFQTGVSDVNIPGSIDDPLRFELLVDDKVVPFKTDYKIKKDDSDATTYSDYRIYWEQVFPPRTPIKIAHSFTPSFASGTPNLKAVCADQKFEAALKRIMNRIDTKLHATEEEKHGGKRSDVVMHYSGFQTFHYILMTAKNWKGPIKNFRLVIDKEDPAKLVSFCEDGVKKISATQFEVKHKNFVPNKNLTVTFVKEPK